MCQSKEVFSLVRKLLKMLRCRPHRLHSKCALDYTTFIPQQSNQEFVSLNSECKLFLSSVYTLQSGENFVFWSETKCIDYWMSLSLSVCFTSLILTVVVHELHIIHRLILILLGMNTSVGTSPLVLFQYPGDHERTRIRMIRYVGFFFNLTVCPNSSPSAAES